MLKLLRYIFYRAYKFGSSLGRNDPTALIVFLSFPIGFNIFSFVNGLLIIMRWSYPETSSSTNVPIAIIYFIMIYMVNKYLASPQRIKVIFKEFENISNKEKYRLNFLAIVYPLVSVILAVFLANIVRAKEYLNW